MMKKEQILAKASDLVTGDRAKEHCDLFRTHVKIAELWTAHLDHKLKGVYEVNAGDVAIMMALLKVARMSSGKFNADDYVDAAGYMAIAGEINYDDEDTV